MLVGGDGKINEITAATIAEWLALFVRHDDVCELRALKVFTRQYTKPRTEAGFFDGQHLDIMAEEAMRLTPFAGGVYLTINPLKSEILARCANRIKIAETGDLAGDQHISRRRWLYVDVDPVRIAGIGATDAEKASAFAVADVLRRHLAELGYPDPIFADSGNGCHLFYAVDLPVDDGGLVKRCLETLAEQFDTADAKVDISVYNAARIAKIPGTIARKGDATPDRPHRRGRIIEAPEIQLVSMELLEALGGKVDAAAPPPQNGNGWDQTATSGNHAWGKAGLRAQCNRVRNAPKNNLHYTLASAACSVGRLVPNFLSFDEAEAALYEATEQAGGQDMAAARKTIQGQLRVGMERPASPQANGHAHANGHANTNGHQAPPTASAPLQPKRIERFALGDLIDQNPKLNEPLIHGILREREIVNIISYSKIGKSWLMYYLSLCIATGRKIFDRYQVKKNRVCVIDNELHKATLASRWQTVALAMGIKDPAEYRDAIEIWPLRGNLRDIFQIGPDIRKATGFGIIFIDAKYRMTPTGQSENDNATETLIYNALDSYAESAGAAIGLIHHATKGSQTDKRVTDVGAGAGAQSRAADTHIVLREHEHEGVVVLEAALRSFAPVEPLALQWTFPLWVPVEGIDLSQLKGKKTAGESRQSEKDQEGIATITDCLTRGPALKASLLRIGIGKDRLNRLLGKMQSENLIKCRDLIIRGNPTREYVLHGSDFEDAASPE
jgi:hypothetical protein